MSSETSVTWYQFTWCHIPKDLRFHQHYCNIHKSHGQELTVWTVTTDAEDTRILVTCY